MSNYGQKDSKLTRINKDFEKWVKDRYPEEKSINKATKKLYIDITSRKIGSKQFDNSVKKVIDSLEDDIYGKKR